MDLQERVVASIMGALWGAVVGVMLALMLDTLAVGFYSNNFSLAEWKRTVIACATLFGVMGFIFKSSVATVLGTLMAWVWEGIQYTNRFWWHSENTWRGLLLMALIGFGAYSLWR
jgi:hypothetical protein